MDEVEVVGADHGVAASAGSGDPPAVEVRKIVRRFGSVVAVDDVSLSIRQGDFVSLLGPSGCGKTTLLRMIAGLDRQDSGEIRVAGNEISRLPAHRRPVNLVFQRYALFPHMTVAGNVAFSLKLRGIARSDIAARVEAMLELVHLPGYGPRRIDQLSGGQSQRVALARALIDDPPVLLLDEPLAALDLKLRQAMHLELRQIQRRVGSTFIYVTHDQQEAFVLSDRVVLMHAGSIVQDGRPLDVYHRPRNLFAATFLGEANILRGRADPRVEGLYVDAQGIPLLLSGEHCAAGSEVVVCLRPEEIRVRPGPSSDRQPNAADAVVEEVIFLGSLVRYLVSAGGVRLMVEVPAEQGVQSLAAGEAVGLSWDASAPVILAE